jgi:hypothetical protein
MQFTEDVINGLASTHFATQHPRLMFDMLVVQGMWDKVQNMYTSSEINRKDRRFALSQAICNDQWNHVTHMALENVTTPKQRKYVLHQAIVQCKWNHVKEMVKSKSISSKFKRQVFRQVAVHGQWEVALDLATKLSIKTKVFALKTWLGQGHWQCLDRVFSEWTDDDLWWPEQELLEAAQEAAADLEEAMCTEGLTLDNDPMLRLVRLAIQHDQKHFLLSLLRSSEEKSRLYLDTVRETVNSKKWDLVKELAESKVISEMRDGEEDDFDMKVFFTLLRCMVENESARPVLLKCVQVLFEMLDDYEFHFAEDSGGGLDSDSMETELAELLEQAMTLSCFQLAFFLSVVMDEESVVDKVVNSELNPGLNIQTFCGSCFFAVCNGKWISAVKCLEQLSKEQAESIFEEFDDFDASPLIVECRERKMYDWAACIGAWTGKFEGVLSDLKHCTDHTVVNILVKRLKSALTFGHAECCRAILQIIDPLSVVLAKDLLQQAVTSYDSEEMVKVCIEAGLSTHINSCKCTGSESCQDCRISPMMTALENGEKPLVQLLYKSGACSNKDLYHYFTNPSVTGKLTNMVSLLWFIKV